MVTSTFGGQMRIFGAAGQRSVWLDAAANIDLLVHTLRQHFAAGEVLRVTVSRLRDMEMSFLKETPFLEHLAIHRSDGCTARSLHACTGLRTLEVSGDCGPFDFSAFPELELLKLGAFNAGHTGIGSLTRLKQLHVGKVRAAAGHSFPLPPSLSHLEVQESEIESLEFLGTAASLQILSLSHLPAVRSFAPIAALGSLKAIRLLSMKANDYEVIGNCTELSEIDIEDSAPAASIGWVRRLSHLRAFHLLRTDIADGDLSPLAELDSLLWVGGTSKRHFEPSLGSLEKVAAARRSLLGFSTKAEGLRHGLLPPDVIAGLNW